MPFEIGQGHVNPPLGLALGTGSHLVNQACRIRQQAGIAIQITGSFKTFQ